MTEARDLLRRRLKAAQERQADLRELQAWIEAHAAARHEHGDEAWAHDQAFLDGTRPILEWLEREIAEVEQLLGTKA